MSEAKCKGCGVIFTFDGNFPTSVECNCESKEFDIKNN